ncbi:MAG: phosphotriesterase-related protein [Acidimicrobiia bacterium]|nr:MAG: phosphotriesterase-related protein [Acidimicrobiia bacterium]
MASIRTVLGDIPQDELGPTHGHEHVLFAPLQDRGEDLRRLDRRAALAELEAFRDVGGSGLVDATVAELGRDPEALAEISQVSGVHVVVATGHTAQEWWPQSLGLSQKPGEALTEEMVADLSVGIAGTSVRAGVIKVGTSLHEITPCEERVIAAAARAHGATGAPIITHTTAGTMGLQQVALLTAHGVPASRICVGHLDRRLIWEEHLEIARSGAYLGYDQISKERYAPDRMRARFVARLIAAGYGGQLLIGSDLARRSDLLSYGGGPGLRYLLASFVNLLREEGVGEPDVQRLVVDNPRRFLSW